MKLYAILPMVTFFAAATSLFAQDLGSDKHTMFYIDAGQSLTNDEYENDDTPFSLGLLHKPAGKPVVFGFDIATEGAMIEGLLHISVRGIQLGNPDG